MARTARDLTHLWADRTSCITNLEFSSESRHCGAATQRRSVPSTSGQRSIIYHRPEQRDEHSSGCIDQEIAGEVPRDTTSCSTDEQKSRPTVVGIQVGQVEHRSSGPARIGGLCRTFPLALSPVHRLAVGYWVRPARRSATGCVPHDGGLEGWPPSWSYDASAWFSDVEPKGTSGGSKGLEACLDPALSQ
jgi:hypothetical protein